MAQTETMKVDDGDGGFVTINVSDFDPRKHSEFGKVATTDDSADGWDAVGSPAITGAGEGEGEDEGDAEDELPPINPNSIDGRIDAPIDEDPNLA